MKKFLDFIKDLKKGTAKRLVDSKIREFRGVKKSRLFSELCFCLLTANYTAEGGIRIQRELEQGFCHLGEKGLARRLRKLGHRYPNARARYIFQARGHLDQLEGLREKSDSEAREWLVRNVKGLGYKESSHFLRNIGFQDLAIIDFHIVDLLVREGLIERPRILTKRKYLEIEELLRKMAGKAGLSLAELDLYLWYAETGKILK